MGTYSVRKSFKFEAAHRLLCMDEHHPCRNLHGHSYVVTVEIFTETLDSKGMVIDFGKLKEFQQYLDNTFDHCLILKMGDNVSHQLINNRIDTFLMENDPTAENMAEMFCRRIVSICKANQIYPNKIRVEVAETVGNIATYEENF